MTGDQRTLDNIDPFTYEPRLKGRVAFSRTIPQGPYSSLRVEVSEEYYLDETNLEDKLENLIDRLHLELIRKGVVKE